MLFSFSRNENEAKTNLTKTLKYFTIFSMLKNKILMCKMDEWTNKQTASCRCDGTRSSHHANTKAQLKKNYSALRGTIILRFRLKLAQCENVLLLLIL